MVNAVQVGTRLGEAEKIESERGKVWYDRIKNRTKCKTALQGLEFAAGGKISAVNGL